MGQHSKRTRAPVPLEAPSSAPHLVPPAAPQLVLPPLPHPFPPSTFPSTHAPGNWMPSQPPQSVAASSAPCWVTGMQQPSVAGSSAQGPCWAPSAGIGGSASRWYTPEHIDDSDVQAWGDSHPRGGFLGFFKNTSKPSQAVSNQSSTQPINVCDDTNGGDCARTEKRLLWTKDEASVAGCCRHGKEEVARSQSSRGWKKLGTILQHHLRPSQYGHCSFRRPETAWGAARVISSQGAAASTPTRGVIFGWRTRSRLHGSS